MKIILRRTVPVDCIHAVGEIAFPQKRVAEHAAVVWAAERLRLGLDARAEMLCDAAAKGPLPTLPKIVGVRLAQICEELGLLRREGDRVSRLTPEGDRVVAGGEPRVYVPELGAWSLFFAEDPLLAQPLLRVETWEEPSAFDEQRERRDRRNKGDRENGSNRRFERVPDSLAALCDPHNERAPLALPASKDGRPLRVVGLESNVEPVKTPDSVTLELSFEPGDSVGRLALRGAVSGKRVDQALPAPVGVSHERVLFELLGSKGAHPFWNSQTRKLRVPFKQLHDGHRKSFLYEMTFRAPQIPELGRFEDTTVNNIPIEPSTGADAQRWFEWLLADRLREPQWPDLFAKSTAELRGHFPAFPIQIPEQRDFADSLRGADRPNAAYWHLRAPLDLNGGAR
jgi:hypothetical protein